MIVVLSVFYLIIVWFELLVRSTVVSELIMMIEKGGGIVIVLDVMVFGVDWVCVDVTCVVWDVDYVNVFVELMWGVFGVEIGCVFDWIFLVYLGGKLMIELKVLICNCDDFSLVYIFGVVWICWVIVDDFFDVRRFIIKCNIVVVVFDGFAVFGFGNFGLFVVLLVMEGKVVLFKWFVGIDVFLLCLDI